ncbi:hypothetical protein ACFL1B_00370 [Nanoarchaeota archaeon]
MELLIAMFLGLFTAYVIIKFVKKGIGLLFGIGIAIGMILLFVGFLVITDALDFRDNFSNSKSIFILADEDGYMTGVVLNFNDLDRGVEPYEDLDDITENKAPDGYYKVFILTKEMLKNSNISDIDIGVADLTKEKLIDILYSEAPSELIAAETMGIEAREIEDIWGDNDRLRRDLFTYILVDVFGRDPMTLIYGVKNGNIIIYPESLMFKTIKYIPSSAFNQARWLLGERDESAG